MIEEMRSLENGAVELTYLGETIVLQRGDVEQVLALSLSTTPPHAQPAMIGRAAEKAGRWQKQ